jgi:hypothetical protein
VQINKENAPSQGASLISGLVAAAKQFQREEFNKIVGLRIDPVALQQMRERGGKWAAYQNMALDSFEVGGLRFLQFGGTNNTFETPPRTYPDTQLGTCWRHCLIGLVDLETGKIMESR